MPAQFDYEDYREFFEFVDKSLEILIRDEETEIIFKQYEQLSELIVQ